LTSAAGVVQLSSSETTTKQQTGATTMGQQHTIGKGNTTVKSTPDSLSVVFHNTEVVRRTGNTIRLDTGGFRSATTKTRMNQTANQYGLPFSVYQKQYNWFVDVNGTTLKFDEQVLEFDLESA
jgi:hypothetical protein